MKNLREVDFILRQSNEHWVGDGFKVGTFFPNQYYDADRFSPFLLLDYNEPYYFEPTNQILGVGGHPHRGFETVTFAYDGAVEHHDNKGNHGIIYKGDVQWMTAGAGIMHKEYHEKEFAKNGGYLHMVQLWVDLPKELKMTTPKYQPILSNEMTKVDLEDNAGYAKLLAGEFMGQKGPAKTFSPMNVYNLYLNQDKKVVLNEPKNYNVQLLVVSGSIKANGETINTHEMVVFKHNSEIIEIESLEEDTIVLVLSGQPLNQPIAWYGPFVMNTEKELREAFDDFEDGKFGPFEF